MKKLIGVLVLIWGVVFAYLETKHFGYNLLPQSLDELSCDITALIVVLFGVYLIKFDIK